MRLTKKKKNISKKFRNNEKNKRKKYISIKGT